MRLVQPAGARPKSAESYRAHAPGIISNPIIVGIPSRHVAPNLFYVLHTKTIGFLIQTQQITSLQKFLGETSKRMCQFAENQKILSALLDYEFNKEFQPISIFHITDSQILKTASNITDTKPKHILLDQLDPISEIEFLFKQEESDDTDWGIVQSLDNEEASQDNPNQLWCADAYEIYFNDSWMIRFPSDEVANIIKESRVETQYISSVKPYDKLLIVSGQIRQSLYHLVLSRVHQHPAIELHLALISRWQQELFDAYNLWSAEPGEHYYPLHSLDGLLSEMQSLGSKIVTTITLDNWINGYVIAPLDPEDILRLAQILNISFVRKNHRSIGRAAARLRSLHRSLSRRLNQWVQSSITGDYSKSDSEIVDEELGLTFGDVRNSLQVLTVDSICKVPGPFLRHNLGQLNKGGNV